MARKAKTLFVCQECGYESPKWMGQCVCGSWNSFVEEKIPETDPADTRRRTSGRQGAPGAGRAGSPVALPEVKTGAFLRMDTGIRELNRVLGGGLVKGSLTLISGEPGIGKSTLILQAAAAMARRHGPVLYVSGEESEEQIRMRADRVCGGFFSFPEGERPQPGSAGGKGPEMESAAGGGPDRERHLGKGPGERDASGGEPRPDASGLSRLMLLSETCLEAAVAAAEAVNPAFLIIDSIQTMYTEELESAPGSVSQVRACGGLLMKLGKEKNLPVFLVAHVTKSGELAGPKTVEHLVDCVLSFSGERTHDLRILRALKNRFGNTSEIGAFEMREEGLTEIENLSAALTSEMESGTEGAVATAVYEGSRPLLLEIQALTVPTPLGFPRRTAVGADTARLHMILAVLERRAGVALAQQDVYVNVAGGLRPESTSVDLAVALALYSTARGAVPPEKTLAIGEIGLTGDLRWVPNGEKMAREALRMGFRRILMPVKNAERMLREREESLKGAGKTGPEAPAEIIGVRNLKEAIRKFVPVP